MSETQQQTWLSLCTRLHFHHYRSFQWGQNWSRKSTESTWGNKWKLYR